MDWPGLPPPTEGVGSRAAAALPPQDGVTQRPLGGVFGTSSHDGWGRRWVLVEAINDQWPKLPETASGEAPGRGNERGYRIDAGAFWPLGMRVVYLRSFMRSWKSCFASSNSFGLCSRSTALRASTLAATSSPL